MWAPKIFLAGKKENSISANNYKILQPVRLIIVCWAFRVTHQKGLLNLSGWKLKSGYYFIHDILNVSSKNFLARKKENSISANNYKILQPVRSIIVCWACQVTHQKGCWPVRLKTKIGILFHPWYFGCEFQSISFFKWKNNFQQRLPVFFESYFRCVLSDADLWNSYPTFRKNM